MFAELSVIRGRVPGWLWRVLAYSMGVAALAVAVVGAMLVQRESGVDGVNAFVESLSGKSATWLGDLGVIAPLGFAFAAGMASAVNPCGFAMLPAYLGLYLGSAGEVESVKGGPAQRHIKIGLLALVAGGIATVVTYAVASPGDTYYVFWGAIVWGAMELGYGTIREMKSGHLNHPARQLPRAFVVGGAVTAGFVLLFGVAGAAIGAGSRFVVDVIPWLGLAIGVLLTMAGSWMLRGGTLYSGVPGRVAARVGGPAGGSNLRGYFLFGLSYGIASLSCTLPIFLLVVVTAAAVRDIPAAIGQFLLYAVGMGTVVMALTLGMALFQGAMVTTVRRVVPYVQPAGSALMILAGAYIVFYWLTVGDLGSGMYDLFRG